MKWWKIIPILYFVDATPPTVVFPHEKLIRVRKPEEAKGKRYFIDFIGLAEKFKYHAEQHEVITDDGYILEIFRIPANPTFSQENDRPIVLVEHGILASSDTWALMNRSIVYVLADAGYDVWVGNYRGNVYGRSHQTLSPEEPLFWNYTWHEIGTLDYTSTIDYVLKTTKKSSLTFIAHSMGGTAAFALLSDRPEYNEKINTLIILSPAVYWVNRHLQRLLFIETVCSLLSALAPSGLSELLPLSTLPLDFLKNFCIKNNILQLCIEISSLFLWADSKTVNVEEFFTFFNYYPAGVSAKAMIHYCHLISYDEFVYYDYGEKNWEHYGQKNPPEYKLSNVWTKTYIFYSQNDWICDVKDAQRLAENLSGEPTVRGINSSKFTHLDFIIGTDVKTLLYDKIVQIISAN